MRATAGHHLFWVRPSGRLAYFRQDLRGGPWPNTPGLDLRTLLRSNPALRDALELWAQANPWRERAAASPAVQQVRSLLSALRSQGSVRRADLQRAMLLVYGCGAGTVLRAMQPYLGSLGPVITPQYRQIFPLLMDEAPRRDELVFHRAHPDMYLWLPPGAKVDRLLVCFCTRSNTLNAPLPLAHRALWRLGVGLLYVYNRPAVDPGMGFQHQGLAASAGLIRRVAAAFGFRALYGLGASLGGYAACRYAGYLELERVLNFSGAVASGGTPGQEGATWHAPSAWLERGYSPERVLTVLSRNDAVDQKILRAYDQHAFVTPRAWVEASTHGSFTAAWVEGRLPGLLGRLLQVDGDFSPSKSPAPLDPAAPYGQQTIG